MPETAPAQKLDDETTAALTLLNEYVNADREATRHKREISKAEKVKDQAAAAVRKLEKEGGTAEQKAEAETAYRDSVAALKAVREGRKPEAAVKSEPSETPAETAAEPEAAEDEADKSETAGDTPVEVSDTEAETPGD